MSLSLKIHITKEILQKSHKCDADKDFYKMGKKCAVAIALQDIFPEAHVTSYYIFPFGLETQSSKDLKISLPLVAQQFVKLFDGFHLVPNLRLLLPEFEFTIEVPDAVINAINIDEIREVIENTNRQSFQQKTSLRLS